MKLNDLLGFYQKSSMIYPEKIISELQINNIRESGDSLGFNYEEMRTVPTNSVTVCLLPQITSSFRLNYTL